MYALVMLMAALFVGFWWLVLTEKHSWGLYCAFTLTALLLVATHYLGLFLVLAAVFSLLVAGKLSWKPLLAMAAVALIAAFLLRESILAVTGNLFQYFATTPFYVLLSQPLTTFWLGSADVPTQAQWWYLPFVILLLAGLLLRRSSYARRWWLFASCGIFGTIAIAFLVGIFRPNYSNPRHLTMLLPIVYIVMARGTTALAAWHKLAALLPYAGAVTLSALSFSQIMRDPPVVRDDIAGITAYLAPRVRPGDLILWHDYDVSVTYDFYALDTVPYATLPRAFQDQVSAENELIDLLADKQRVWFVTARPQDSLVSSWLRDNWVVATSQTFEGSWIYPNVTLYRDPQQSDLFSAETHTLDLQHGAVKLNTINIDNDNQTGKGMWADILWSGEADGHELCVGLKELTTAENAQIHTQSCQQLRPEMANSQLIWLPLPRGMPPIPYQFFVSYADKTQIVTELELMPGLEETGTRPVATFDGLAVESVDWLNDRFTANNWAIGSFVFAVEAPVPPSLQWQIRLVNWLQQPVDEAVVFAPVSAEYQPQSWQNGDILRATFALPLPFSADGRYALQLRTTTETATSNWQTVGHTRVDPWPMRRNLPENVPALGEKVQLGDAIELAAYQLERTGDNLSISLFWRADAAISADYHSFIHVAQPGEPPLFDAGGIPVNNARPTSTWRRGEIIVDTYQMQLSAEFAQPGYNVAIGLFEPSSGVRLPITVDGAAIADGIYILEALP